MVRLTEPVCDDRSPDIQWLGSMTCELHAGHPGAHRRDEYHWRGSRLWDLQGNLLANGLSRRCR